MLPIRREPLSADDRTTLGRILAVDQALTLPGPSVLRYLYVALILAIGVGLLLVVGAVLQGTLSVLWAVVSAGGLIAAGAAVVVAAYRLSDKPRTLTMTPSPSMDQAARAMLDSGEAIIAEVVCDAAWTMPDEYPDPGLPRVLVRLAPDRFMLLPEAPAIDGPDGGPYHIPARSDVYLSALPEHEPWILHSHEHRGAERLPLREDLLKLSEVEADNDLEEFRAYTRAELPERWRAIVSA